ncbi:hypothetical protein Patl1_32414 [Pistacia atlantica]|uniref:Uncharacterized protein n=1 Tax=Pistacia atlantica TaxID=434234 RepID=A0ACC1AP71_9ROSI|nr:hypothetical protein Patl1_32414 [Pistacia atlantica]
MEGISHPIPKTVEEVFGDFKGIRAGLIKALTTDVEKFYQQSATLKLDEAAVQKVFLKSLDCISDFQ